MIGSSYLKSRVLRWIRIKENIKKFHSDKDSYDGVIYYNGTEYEFEIDAFTGRIIDWDVEKK